MESHSHHRIVPLFQLLLDHNQMDSIPESFNSLGCMTKLSCSDNAIRHIPLSASENWTSLRYIDVSNNLLTSLPSNLNHWHQLQYINSSRNKLTSLPHEFGQLFKLEELHFSKNKIKELGKELGMLLSVHLVDFSYNHLEEVRSYVEGEEE